MPTLRSLSGSSVRSGLISLIAPTKVVFPTPKPPAMRKLAVAAGPVGAGAIRAIEGHRAPSSSRRWSVWGLRWAG